MGIIIIALASFLLTMLYVDFTDSDMNDSTQELSGSIQGQQRGELEGEQDQDGELQDEGEEGSGGEPVVDSADGARPPEVLNIQPFHGPARGGLELTIHGHHFMGFGDWTTTAVVDGKQCGSTEVLNFESLICTLPAVSYRLS